MTTISSDTPEPGEAAPLEERSNVPRVVRVLLVLLTLVVLALYGADVGGSPRIVLSLLFVSLVPGAAIMSHARPADWVTVVSMSIAISLSTCALVASAAVWLRLYSPTVLLGLISTISILLLLHRPARSTMRVEGGKRFRVTSTDLPPGRPS